jgi:hypothetical protein
MTNDDGRGRRGPQGRRSAPQNWRKHPFGRRREPAEALFSSTKVAIVLCRFRGEPQSVAMLTGRRDRAWTKAPSEVHPRYLTRRSPSLLEIQHSPSAVEQERKEVELVLAPIILPVLPVIGGADADARLRRHRGCSGDVGGFCGGVGGAVSGADARSASISVGGGSLAATTGSLPTGAAPRRGRAKSSWDGGASERPRLSAGSRVAAPAASSGARRLECRDGVVDPPAVSLAPGISAEFESVGSAGALRLRGGDVRSRRSRVCRAPFTEAIFWVRMRNSGRSVRIVNAL